MHQVGRDDDSSDILMLIFLQDTQASERRVKINKKLQITPHIFSPHKDGIPQVFLHQKQAICLLKGDKLFG
jgi:hypothetical protein